MKLNEILNRKNWYVNIPWTDDLIKEHYKSKNTRYWDISVRTYYDELLWHSWACEYGIYWPDAPEPMDYPLRRSITMLNNGSLVAIIMPTWREIYWPTMGNWDSRPIMISRHDLLNYPGNERGDLT